MSDYIMTNTKLCGMLLHIANDLKTLYVMGGIGYRLDSRGKARSQALEFNQRITRRNMIYAASSDTFAFDCVCLVKSVLWGFTGDMNGTYGGAKYASNGIPDCNIDTLYNMCTKKSTDMKDIADGEFLVLHSHHCGVYIGGGMVVESTPAWENKVQVTKLSQRNWKRHGYLPKVKYEVPEQLSFYEFPDKTDTQLAYEVIKGLHGNGEERKKVLGSRYRAVQDKVNAIAKGVK